MSTRLLDVNGIQHFVRDDGEGMPVILLHGFPDTGDLWRHQVGTLVRAGFRTIVPDMRGRGRTERPSAMEAYQLSNMVRDVTGILDALGIQRAHVVGHDWGAAVAWLVGSLAPDRVDRLVVLSVGAPGTLTPSTLEALQKGWYNFVVLFEGSEQWLQRDDWYLLRELLQGAGDTEAYITTLADPGALTAGLNWYRANMTAESIVFPRIQMPAVRAPTLGIWSAGDLYLTEQRMRRSQAAVEGSWRYERVEGSHWIPLDQADRLNALLLEFLR